MNLEHCVRRLSLAEDEFVIAENDQMPGYVEFLLRKPPEGRFLPEGES